MRYQVYTYDVWGNKTDGFFVNDVFKSNMVLELPDKDDLTNMEIIKAMRDQDILKPRLHIKSFEIEGELGHCLYINDIREISGYFRPLCELRRIE